MQSNVNGISIGFFFAFMALTMFITYWAAKRTNTTEQFFAAGGKITAWQNGWALAGDFLSAAALLGIAGIITANGFDGMIYSIGWLVGWPFMLFLIVEPLRNVGTFTFADVVAYRLKQKPVRSAAAIGTLAIILFYLIAQMVATGSLIKLLFGIPYVWSVILVGSVMLLYVLFGGMLATTWVQVVKAILLLVAGALLAFLVLRRFDLSPLKLFTVAAEKYGTTVLQPGTRVVSGQWDAISLGLGLMFGTAAMPHVLMRIYTVKDVKAARLSIHYATGLIGIFHLFVLVIGFGAMVIVGPEIISKAGGGGNMAAPMLAEAVGGDAFFGFVCAVAFATMLAVVAGLTLSGVATLSHDVWVNVIKSGDVSKSEQLRIARASTILIAVFAVILNRSSIDDSDRRIRRNPGNLVRRTKRRVHGGTRIFDRVCGQFPIFSARHNLEAFYHRGRGLEHPDGSLQLSCSDTALAHDPNGRAWQNTPEYRRRLVVRAIEKPGHHLHASLIRGRRERVAPDP